MGGKYDIVALLTVLGHCNIGANTRVDIQHRFSADGECGSRDIPGVVPTSLLYRYSGKNNKSLPLHLTVPVQCVGLKLKLLSKECKWDVISSKVIHQINLLKVVDKPLSLDVPRTFMYKKHLLQLEYGCLILTCLVWARHTRVELKPAFLST